jgi:tetratricopeptide (TPR) repeat protein
MTDSNAEFQRYRSLCMSAAAALQSGNFVVASEQFTQALGMARQYSPRSVDEANCLHGLADSYFGQYKFVEAKTTYQQLEQLLESWGETVSERRFAISLQLARCHEKVHEFEQACSIYATATEVAEVTLRYGDQKMTNILESYANALRTARKDPQKLAEIEQKARLSLSKQSNPQFLSSIVAKETDRSGKYAAIKEDTTSSRTRIRQSSLAEAAKATEEEAKLGAFQEFTKEHPKITMGCICALLIGLLQVLCLVSAINDIKGVNPPPASSPAAVGNVFTSADGKETLEFKEHGKVFINGAAGSTNARCYVASPGWSEFIATIILQKPNQLWLVPNSMGLQESKGNKQLYDLKKCPIVDLPPKLSAIAQACQIYTIRYDKYPDANDLLGSVPGIADKLSDGKDYLPVFVAGDKDVMAKDIHKFINDRKMDLVHDKLPVSKIVCMTMPKDKKLIIVPTDSTGFPYKSQAGIQLAIAVSDGELLASDGLSTKLAFFTHLPKSVVISASSPAFIQQLYLDFLYALGGAVVLAFAALKLIALSTPNSRGEALPHRVKVIAWLVWGIITMVLLYRLATTSAAYLFRS